uniref:NADH dehydrogenase [ubiquinone] 1 alpha subcomplex subunit 2 n=1 Tax=Octopus bimaculoides TaxID=37653 RepID=A0A0L8IAK0_OCTBM
MAASKAVRFGQHLKELRVHLCQRCSSSKGVRDFIEQHYVAIKQQNPHLPILIRECNGIQPKIFARFDYGRESSLPLTGFTSGEVLEAVNSLSSV